MIPDITCIIPPVVQTEGGYVHVLFRCLCGIKTQGGVVLPIGASTSVAGDPKGAFLPIAHNP